MTFSDDVQSLLLSDAGDVSFSTEHNIGYRTGYFSPTDDFDLDGELDQAILHNDEYYVYLGGDAPEYDETTGEPINEDFRRQPDQINDYQDRGLLTSISVDDLKETDLYIYRVSTGELLVERQNLRSEEYARLSDGGVDEEGSEASFYYRQLMRGPRVLEGTLGNQISNWWSDADIRIELFDNFSADFLRMGESVQIVAINRPTGYIGTTTAELTFNTESGNNTLDVPIDTLELRPPNLRIRAERRTETELGLTAGEINDYLIGSEGAGLTSDQYIMIKTEWFDHDGSPLPSDLPGYSGTLAKILGNQQLNNNNACATSASPIEIQPGSRIQLLKLGDNCDLGTEHYYVYICGHNQADSAQDKCYNFNEVNEIGRPQYYVPVQVPFYDEVASRAQYNAYRYAEQNAEDDEDIVEPEDIYLWHYRPEMQFSIYDLMVEEVQVANVDEDGNADIIDILNGDTPVIGSDISYATLLFDLVSADGVALESFGPDRELVFAFGEDEVLATIGEDQTLQFDNLDHLASLSPEDFLSIRLYANNDAANILWEYAFEHVVLDTQFAEFDSSIGETLYISADEPTVPLQALLIGYADRSESIKDPVTLQWRVNGQGTLETITETNEDLGVFFNEIELPTITGSTAEVSVNLTTDPDIKVTLPPIEVVSGDPAQVTHNMSGTAKMLGASEAVVTFTIRDQFGNLVTDGTGVSFLVAESLELVDSSEATENGIASVSVTGTEHALASSVTLVIGELEYAVDMEVEELNVNFEMADSIIAGEAQALTVVVTDNDGQTIEGVDVTLGSTYGFIGSRVVTTGSDRTATTTFTAPNAKGEGEVTAQLGLISQFKHPISVIYNASEPRDLEVGNIVVIGDAANAGSITHMRYDTTPIDVAFPTSELIYAQGQPGDIVNIQIGDAFDPNLVPVAAYYMNEVDTQTIDDTLESVVLDETGRYPLIADFAEVIDGTRLGEGKSLSLYVDENEVDEDGNVVATRLTAADLSVFDLEQNVGFSAEVFLHDTNGGALIDLGGGLRLRYETSRLHLDLVSANGTETISSGVVMPGRWYQTAARYVGGQLELVVNDESVTASSSETVLWANNTLSIGGEFSGRLNSVKIYDYNASPVLQFENGEASISVAIGDTGSETVIVSSTGQMHSNASQLGLQRVAIHTGMVKQYASLLSVDYFTQIAGQFVDTLATDTPEINLAALEAYGQPDSVFANVHFSLFPKAHAQSSSGFVWGLINWIIPLESFSIAFEQLGYLVSDSDKFDASEFIIALVDVLTIFPPAKPLKAFVIPLRALTRGLKNINPKFMTYFAGVLSRVMSKAKKGDFDTLWNLLPFMVLAAELYTDEESREGLEFLMSTVDSADDLFSWVDYLALPADGWDGDEIPQVDPFSSSDSVAQNTLPLSFMFNQAHAQANALRLSKNVIAASLSRASRRISKESVENVPDALAQLVKSLKNGDATELRKYIFGKNTLSSITSLLHRGGARSLSSFLKGHTNARYHQLQILAMTAYLEWEASCGKSLDIISGEIADASDEEKANASENLETLECGDKGLTGRNNRREMYKLFTSAFTDTLTGEYDEEDPDASFYTVSGFGHGALFHMAQIAQYQLLHRAGGPAIKAIEGIRWVWLYDDDDALGDLDEEVFLNQAKDRIQNSYQRKIDIVLGDQGEPEQWIELKSYKAVSESVADRTYLDVLKLSATQKRSIPKWTFATATKGATKNKGKSLHRQFSIDRAAANVKHARLSPNNNKQYVRVDVSGDFLWRFQSFDRTWRRRQGATQNRSVNVNLGSQSDVNTVKGALVREVTGGSTGQFKKVFETNMGRSISANDHIQLANAKSLIQDLAAAGFDEVNDIPLDFDAVN